MPFDKDKPYNDLPFLPPGKDIETKAILKQAIKSNKALAELKSRGRTLPNQSILINNLVLLEAQASSEIENIFTTHDKLFQAQVIDQSRIDPQTKEVLLYREALFKGITSISQRPLNTNNFIEIVQIIKRTDAGIRTTPGTKISAPNKTIIYTPPEGEDLLRRLLKNLEDYIHTDDGIDPLIKMAVLHYQFEAIHPFTDGNGRTGRVLNILYLMQQGLLDKPILFLSSHIIVNKTPYYQGLRAVTEEHAWEEWILYMLEAVETTSYKTMEKIQRIEESMHDFINVCRQKTTIYSKDLIELLYEQPYTRISDVAHRLNVSRQTAASYLKKLENCGLLARSDNMRTAVYLNIPLIKSFSESL